MNRREEDFLTVSTFKAADGEKFAMFQHVEDERVFHIMSAQSLKDFIDKMQSILKNITLKTL
jgi:hypothetical protein